MKKLYFVAVMPPENIQKEVTGIKLHFKEVYNAKHALKSPPHITLIPPIKWPEERENEIINALNEISSQFREFTVRLNGFGAFPPRVIFIDIENIERLRSIYSKIIEYMDNEFNIADQIKNINRFNPHMTVATRDLTKENFKKAWEIYGMKNFSKEFKVDKTVLLKHNGQFWEKHSEALFGNN